jgi:MFS-type transporter involved in bile tolerance (Atg22 family)
MKPTQFEVLFFLVLFSTLMLFGGMYLLAKFNRLFQRIKSEFLRKNIVVWMIAICLITATAPTTPDFYGSFLGNKLQIFYAFEILQQH